MKRGSEDRLTTPSIGASARDETESLLQTKDSQLKAHQFLIIGRTTSTGLQYMYRDVWRRAVFKIKVQRVLKTVKEELLVFGTNHDLADQNMRYKANIDDLIDKRARKAEDFRNQTTTYFLHQAHYRCLISPNSLFKQVWNLLITVLLTYTATIMPFRFAFYETVFWDGWTVLELTLDFLFLCDVVISFFSIYTKSDGTVITNRARIIRKYLKTWFVVDIIASIPYTIFDLWISDADASQPRVNVLLRLVRLPRLYKLFRLLRIMKAFRSYSGMNMSIIERVENFLQLNSRKCHPGLYKLIKFLLTVLVAVHIATCIWFFFSRLSDFDLDTWVVRCGFSDKSDWQKYLAAFYWTVTTMVTVGYGDITPGNNVERIVGMLWMFIGVGFYTYTIGSLSTFLMSIDTRESILTAKLGAVQEMYKQTGISKITKNKIQLAIRFNTFRVGNVWDNSLFDELPKALKYDVVTSMYGGAFKDFPFFSKRDIAFVLFVMPKLRPLSLKENEYLYHEGEYADAMHMITRGRVNLVLTHSEIVYKAYLRGSYIGEVELIKGTPRDDNTIAYGRTELLSLDKKEFFEMMNEFPTEGKEIRKLASLRQRQNKLALMETRELIKLKQELGSLSELAGRKQILLPLEDLEEEEPDLCMLMTALIDELQLTKKELAESVTLISGNNAALLDVEKRVAGLKLGKG